MAFASYQQWNSELARKQMILKAQIEKLNLNQSDVWLLVQNELDKLSNLKALYTSVLLLKNNS